MTLYAPRKGRKTNNKAHPSPGNSITEQIDKGSDIEAKYASDINGIIYIQDPQTDRFVAFKAFLNSFTLDIKPSVTLDRSIFITDPFISNGQTMFTYKVSLDVPAYNAAEAEANLAKMQELFRVVGTIGNRTNPAHGVGIGYYDYFYEFKVYFANLIQNGWTEGGPTVFLFDETNPQESIIQHGIGCIIKNIEYKPSTDVGFIEKDNKFLPKHYTLDLELIMTDSQDSLSWQWPFGMALED
tara:strand:- start:23 stop:745 length:723 start_codon:yes stop_codon:yes gene_type:complete